jgi:protein-S-isoprenylcysteine O-methyltransferase Ste14
MVVLLFWIFQASVLLWLLAEVVLQTLQYRRGGHARTTEWRSLGMIVICIFAGNVLARLTVGYARPLALHIPLVVVFLVAIPILWLGVGFRLWAMRTLGRFFRGVVHVQHDHQVVRHGPYRLIRHPSYTGVLVAILGISLLFNNILAMILFVGCTFAGILYRIRVEERVLTQSLGVEYTDYSASTARLVPGVW